MLGYGKFRYRIGSIPAKVRTPSLLFLPIFCILRLVLMFSKEKQGRVEHRLDGKVIVPVATTTPSSEPGDLPSGRAHSCRGCGTVLHALILLPKLLHDKQLQPR